MLVAQFAFYERGADVGSFTKQFAAWRIIALALAGAVIITPRLALADEGGVSFWLPGLYGSLAATPQQPGFSFATLYYHTSVKASGDVSAARQVEIGRFTSTLNVNLNAHIKSYGDLALFNPSYVFTPSVLGGQLAVGLMSIYGRVNTSLTGTASATLGPLAAVRSGTISDTTTAFGDLYPVASLRWNAGVHNFMTYVTGDIPVGAYDSRSLANLGIGHGAIDSGVGYTYFDPQKGHEFSMVAGLTYNFSNPSTNYRNGDDFHLDWGASQFLTKQMQVGVVGYVYDQITPDSGQPSFLGSFESRVVGIGPQMGFIFPVGGMQGYLNLKGYGEFDAHDRPHGWNTWLTFAISPAPPEAAPRTARVQ